MTEELKKKVDFAIRLLRSAEKMAEKVGQPVEICYSGGKDSDVILELARMAGINYRAIYKNTTIDPPGTIKHAKEQGAEVVRPKKSFRELMIKKGFPSRTVRFCCSELKEYKILDYAVVGVRRDESAKRAERYKEPEICRVYNKQSKTRQYLPLLEWTKEDVEAFIAEREIKCHPLYYDEQGRFHVERRLGCMGCPIAHRKNRIECFKAHPRLVKMWCQCGKQYLKNHESTPILAYFRDVYEWFTMTLFCDTLAEFRERFGATLFIPPIDCKKFLEDYFHVEL